MKMWAFIKAGRVPFVGNTPLLYRHQKAFVHRSKDYLRKTYNKDILFSIRVIQNALHLFFFVLSSYIKIQLSLKLLRSTHIVAYNSLIRGFSTIAELVVIIAVMALIPPIQIKEGSRWLQWGATLVFVHHHKAWKARLLINTNFLKEHLEL